MTTPDMLTWLPLRRRFRSLVHGVFMVAMIVATAIGLTWLDVRALWPGQGVGPEDLPGSGVIVRTEVLHLWLQESLMEPAGPQPESSVARTHRELRAILECRGQEGLWYALTSRGHQVDGGSADITLIRHPYGDAEHFREFLDVLATAAGHPTPYHAGAQVHFVAGDLSGREPREVIEESLSPPSLPRESLRESSRDRRIPSKGLAVDRGLSTSRPRSPRRSLASPSRARGSG
jgi:hypothetical protein